MRRRLAFCLMLMLVTFFACSVSYASTSSSNMPAVKSAIDKAKRYMQDLEKKRKGLPSLGYTALAAVGESVSTPFALKVCEQLASDEDLLSGDTNTYCMLIFSLLATGYDPYNFKGENYLEKIQRAQLPSGKFADNIISGGEDLLHAHIWAVLALTASDAQIPNKEKALQWLISQQHEDGSFYWNLKDKKTPDVDSTGMALMALGALGADKNSGVVQKAVRYLQSVQKESGGFESWGAENPECCSMVIRGLVAVGIDPAGTEFTKPGNKNPVSALLDYQLSDGSFEHIKGSGSDFIATYQALTALGDFYYGNTFFERLRNNFLVSRQSAAQLIIFKVGDKRCAINSSGQYKYLDIDAAPFTKNGRLYVPVRYLAYALGIAKEGIVWDNETKTISLSMGNKTVKLVVGKNTINVNGIDRIMDVSPIVVAGRTYLPARFVAEAFGFNVHWDSSVPDEVTITNKNL